MLKKLSLILACALAMVSCGPSLSVYDLTCEGLSDPLAIDSAEPHFSWKISSEAPASQVAYQIQVSSSLKDLKSGKAVLWDSGRVVSPDQVMIPYSGTPLVSRQQCWWRVRIWKSDKEVSGWSSPRRFGMAILYVNSLGYHEAYVNGSPVSEAVLSPAVSQLDKRSLIMAYDVTSLLRKGKNEIVLWIGSGWNKVFNPTHDGPLVKAELDGVTPVGAEVILNTDASWEGTWSGYSDLTNWRYGKFGGESIDASIAPETIESQSLDQLSWAPVDVVKVVDIKATAQMCEPCVVQETLSAKSIKPYGEGRWVVDFGRIVNGLLDRLIHKTFSPPKTKFFHY